MLRLVRLHVLTALSLLVPLSAQAAEQQGRIRRVSPANYRATGNWAEKMFDRQEHNFETVARGAEAKTRFTIKNLYKETVHVASISKSCGCTSATLNQDTLASYETGEIEVTFDSRKFVGHKESTVTVIIDRPFYAEVRLRIHGYIRSDVVVEPGSVNFGTLDQGAGSESRVAIAYAGRSNWRIQEVRTANPYLEAEVAEKGRNGTRVDYELHVRLKSDAPAGYFRDQIVVVTDDGTRSELPVLVEAKVEPAVSVNPSPLYLGILKPGQTITKPVVVKAKKPFRIIGVTAPDSAVEFKASPSTEAKTVHVLPVTLTAEPAAGRSTVKFVIETDLPEGQNVEFSAYAQVRDDSQAESTARPSSNPSAP